MPPTRPWDELDEIAAGQAGHFTSQQAVEAGISAQLLSHHVRHGGLLHVHRGVYRLARFPVGEHDDLVAAALWAGADAVISHDSALALHGLSDALPAKIHVSVPSPGLRSAPLGVLLMANPVADVDRTWIGAVPVTTAARAVRDVAAASGDADLVEQAIEQGIRRGLFRFREVASAAAWLAGQVLG